MRTLTGLLLISSLLFGLFAGAQTPPEPPAQQPEQPAEQPVEFTVPDAIVEEHKTRLDIHVGDKEYIIQDPTGEDRALYDALSNEDKERFDNNRRLQLGRLARALQSMKYGFGIGSLIGNKMVFAYHKTFNGLRRVSTFPFTPDEWELYKSADKHAGLTLRERSEAMISKMLISIDRSFWAQAPLFAHSNEFGIMGSAGLQAIAGADVAGRRGGFGGLFDVGFSIGFNRDNRAVVIQIFRDFETFSSTKGKAFALAGTLFKAGMYIAHQDGSLKAKGSSFYPPMFPGYTSSTPRSFSTGFSTGINIPPISDLFTYTNNLEQTTMIKISVSPLLRGYVRIETGVGRKVAEVTTKYFMEPIARAVRNVRGISVISCRQLFSM